jgi:RHS repeat-associated protein
VLGGFNGLDLRFNAALHKKIAGGVTRTYIWDGPQLAEERSGSGTIRYFEEPGIDQWLGRQETDASATYFVGDHLGNVTQHTNSSGTVTLARTYDPWGNLDSTSAATSGPAFTGREWDSETGLYYYRARYYYPSLGRFISEDPAGRDDGPNLYTYARGNPIAFVDPTGLKTLICGVFRTHRKPKPQAGSVMFGVCEMVGTCRSCVGGEKTIVAIKVQQFIEKDCPVFCAFIMEPEDPPDEPGVSMCIQYRGPW